MAPPQQKKPYLRPGRRESATDFYNLESDSKEKDTVWSGTGDEGPQPVAEEKRRHTDRPEPDVESQQSDGDQPEVRPRQSGKNRTADKPSQAEGDRETVEEDLEQKQGSRD